MDIWWVIVLCVAVLQIVGAMCMFTVWAVCKHGRIAGEQHSRAMREGFEKLLQERHWWSQHSIEARLADSLGETVKAATDALEESHNKVLAFTEEGRDLVEARERVQVLKDQLSVREEQHSALMRLLEVKKHADREDRIEAGMAGAGSRVKTVENGTARAHFGGDPEV